MSPFPPPRHTLSGALGGALGSAADQLMNEGRIDPGTLLLATVMGGVSGRATARGIQSRHAACFAAGTPLLWEHGSKPIEQFKVGERLWSRDEYDPDGPLELKEIEEVFVRFGAILHLHVAGQVIRTTAEHPFYVRGKGWIDAVDLQLGDLLSSHDGQWLPVEEVYETGDYEVVYNLRVAKYHTYYVGCQKWSVSFWAHNAAYVLNSEDIPQLASQYRDMRNSGVRGRIRLPHPENGDPLTTSQMRKVKAYANENFSDLDRRSIPGPRTQHDNSEHNELVARLSANLPDGHDIIGGGRSANMAALVRERYVDTPGGYTESRRPDILIQRPDGSRYGINVGLSEGSGVPILRERQALHDLTVHGRLEMLFFSYGVQR